MLVNKIQTNDKKREVWTYLGLFSTVDFTKKRLAVIHKDLAQNVSETRAPLICSCIRQAREYYRAARSVSILTKPLLLYYGMYSLAKSLIYLNNPTIERGQINHHGLKRPRVSDNVARLLEATTSECKGLFRQLSKSASSNRCIIKGTEIFRSSISTDIAFPFQCSFGKLDGKRELALNDLFMALPELFELLFQVEMENDKLLKVDMGLEKNISGNWHRMLAIYKPTDKPITVNFLKNKFPEIDNPNERITEDGECFVFQRSLHDDYRTLLPTALVQADGGQLFLILDDNPISDINIHFAVMFILSNVVRYKPPLWLEILDTYYKTIITKFIDVSESKFPNLILNEL